MDMHVFILYSLLVILLLLLLLIAIKKYSGNFSQQDRKFKIVDSVAIGIKQKIIVFSYNEMKIMIGVTPNQISHICTLEDKDTDFSGKLSDIIGDEL